MEFLLMFVGICWSNPKESAFISASDKEYDEKLYNFEHCFVYKMYVYFV